MKQTIYLFAILIMTACGSSTEDTDLSGSWKNGFRKMEITQNGESLKVKGDDVKDCNDPLGFEQTPNGNYTFNKEHDRYELDYKGRHFKIIQMKSSDEIVFFIENNTGDKQICETYYSR